MSAHCIAWKLAIKQESEGAVLAPRISHVLYADGRFTDPYELW
jgi:hypothetical protein